jgi:AhpD family alkylhydroperoxidase
MIRAGSPEFDPTTKGNFMNRRVNIGKTFPPLYQAVAGLEKLVDETFASTELSVGFAHLLRVRASQINGCAFCLRLHTRDALAHGESNERLAVLPAWREASYFSEKEAAALALVEAVTMISDGQVPDAVYEQAAATLMPEEVAAVEWLAVVINAWNRIAITSRYPVKP